MYLVVAELWYPVNKSHSCWPITLTNNVTLRRKLAIRKLIFALAYDLELNTSNDDNTISKQIITIEMLIA